MRISREQLIPSDVPLVGFSGTKVKPVGSVTLPVTIGTYPEQITKDVTFLVVDCSSAYNQGCHQGRPTLNAWRVATSIYHLLLKFQTEYGIGEARGDQVATQECYMVMLEMEEQMTTMNIEEQRVNLEPTEGLETISLDEGCLD